MKAGDKIKICMMAFAICCLTVCTILNIQIAIQKKQIQAVEYAQERIQQLEEEEKENIAYAELKREKLSQAVEYAIGDMQDFLREFKETSHGVQYRREENEALKIGYDKRFYLDTVVLELDRENGSNNYMERYFQVDKASLEGFLGGLQWEEELGAPFYEVEKWGELLPVGDQIWNLYAVESSPDSVPMGVLIQNPLIDFGYKEARAGMKLPDIQETYPEAAKTDNNLSGENFHYLEYQDERYRYYYVTVDYSSNCTVLYVTHR